MYLLSPGDFLNSTIWEEKVTSSFRILEFDNEGFKCIHCRSKLYSRGISTGLHGLVGTKLKGGYVSTHIWTFRLGIMGRIGD